MIRALVALSVFAGTLFAQQSVSRESLYHRVYAVVPMVGSGTPADPSRPMFVPAPPAEGAQPATERPGLLGYQMQLSDDGTLALVEFVFATPAAFASALATGSTNLGLGSGVQAVLPDGSNVRFVISQLQTQLQSLVPNLKLFERGVASKAQIQTEFQRHKANFNIDTFQPVRVL